MTAQTDSVRETLKALLDERGLTMAEASRRLGRNPAYVQQFIERGSPRRLPEDVREALAAMLEVDERDLRPGALAPRAVAEAKSSSPPAARAAHEHVPAPEKLRRADFGAGLIAPREWPRDVPVLGSAACGQDGLFDFNGEVVDRARRPPRLAAADAAYALYVASDSMFPWRKPGQLVYVHPGLPVRVEDFVVVQLRTRDDSVDHRFPAYVKQLVRMNQSEVRLVQFNPKKELTLKRSDIKSIHRIVDWDELLGI